MKILQKIFGINTIEPVSPFSVEFYPLTNRYYPKWKSYYMITRSNTGITELIGDHLFAYAQYGDTEKDADEIIARFKEQQLKENVKTIKK
jgi:hypothetical protein